MARIPPHGGSGALMDPAPAIAPDVTLDRESRQWLAELRPGDPHHHQATVRLHALLVRVARHELGSRHAQLGPIAGPEFDDLAQQAADDAFVAILKKLGDFRGLSRFTTWAYKFVIAQVSAKVAAHHWQRHPPSADELSLADLPDVLAPRPGDRLQQREQLEALKDAIGTLTKRQREVFVAVALNDVPMDVLALQLGSNRNAIYKNLFDARRRLRQQLAAAGHPVSGQEA